MTNVGTLQALGAQLAAAAEEIRSWGHTEGSDLILKSDTESAMLTLRDAIGRYLGGKITPENSPVGESQANGAVEEAANLAHDLDAKVQDIQRTMASIGEVKKMVEEAMRKHRAQFDPKQYADRDRGSKHAAWSITPARA